EKSNASKEKERILSTMETELAVESLIKSKNLPESHVVITENSVCVTVDKQELDTNTVAKICDIVMRETGKSADKIVVQSKY
ncbi:MAG: SpoIIIAH-like family protein, partial [Firmicutes bacterium]|nr:SpoIIIAH-like family protein [Bacillota bacterium]